VPVAAVQLIYQVMTGKEASVVAVRKSLAKLLDRNLLQGTAAVGVHPHDLVRDFMRRKLSQGGKDAIREKQRPLVRAIVTAQSAGGGWAPSVLNTYVRMSLPLHMKEAVLASGPAHDSEAQSWVGTDDVLNDFVARSAADVIGAGCLQAWADQQDAAGDLFAAAKLRVCASTTTEIRGGAGFALGMQSGAATALVDEALACLARCETERGRTLEALVIGSQLATLGFGHPSNIARAPRLFELVAIGVHVTSPAELFALGFAVSAFSVLDSLGIMGTASAGNHTDLRGLDQAYGSEMNKKGMLLMNRAAMECPDDRH
jgi:hypothetical protein